MEVSPDDTLDPEALIEDGAVAQVSAEERNAEEAAARRLAERYRLDFLDMHEFRIDQELFRSIPADRSEEHTSELQSQSNLVCRLLLEKKKKTTQNYHEAHR